MKNTKEAIRYGIDTLGVSSDKLFSLIESSNGYQGEDYQRWLANEIIKIAEKEGIGFSQLLVKKFNILQDLIDSYGDNTLSDKVVSFITKQLSNNGENTIFSTEIEEVGTLIEDVDWFKGIDINESTGTFISELEDSEFKEKFLQGEPISLFIKLNNKACSKGSDLFKDAKSRGIVCKTEGALMLYRMCNLLDAYEDITSTMTVSFLASTSFLYNNENQDIIRYFLNYFNYKGTVLKASELFTDSFDSSKYAFVICSPRNVKSKKQDGFLLPNMSDKQVMRYSRSTTDMLDLLKNFSKQEESTAVGYLDYTDPYNLNIGIEKKDVEDIIPITKEDLKFYIAYYGVSRAMKNFGLMSGIKWFIDGNPEFKKLLYNCIPIFLYDIGSNIPIDDIVFSSLMEGLILEGEIYFSYETKEVFNICKGFLDYLKNENIDNSGKTFNEVRKASNHADLNKSYLTAMNNLYEYVSSLYRKVE